MKQIKISLILTLIPLLGLWAEPINLTVDQAVEMALENNPGLLAAEINLSSSERAYNDRWNVFFPDITASTTLSRSNEATTMSGQALIGISEAVPGTGIYDTLLLQDYSVEVDPWTLIANIQASLALTPALLNGVEQLKLNQRSSQLDLQSQEQEITLTIEKVFYQILLFQEQIKLLEKNIETMENRLLDMQLMYNNGMITQLDLLQTESGLAQMRPGLTTMKNTYEMILMNLRMTLGLELDQPINLSGVINVDPQNLNADELVDQNISRRLDIQQLYLNQEIIKNGISATVNQKQRPTLILSWGYQPMLSDPFNSSQWESSENWSNRGSLSLTLSLPVDEFLPHSSGANSILEQEKQLDAFQLQMKQAIQGAEMEIRSLVMNLNSSGEKLQALKQSVEISQENLKLSSEAYRNGQRPLSDLETAEDDLLQAESDLLAEKYNYISSQLDLEAATGKKHL